MDSRGQASVEYIFLILIFLIVLVSVTIPFAGEAISSSHNVSVTSDAKTAVSTIANAVNVVYSNGPGAKRTVNVYIPQDTQLIYIDDSPGKALALTLSDIPVNASNPSVTKSNVNSTISYPVTVVPGGTINEGWHIFTVTWEVESSSITVTVG